MKKVYSILILLSFTLFLGTRSVYAETGKSFKELAENITNNFLLTGATLIMTAAFAFFFFGLVVFIYGRATGKGTLDDLKKGQKFMLWGLIALFIMVSIWGIIRLSQELLGIDGGDMNIQPVRIVMNNPQSTNNSGGGGNAPKTENNNNPQGSFSKLEGEECTGLPGLESECAANMFCRDSNNKPVAAGVKGTCQKEEVAAPKILLSPGMPFPGNTLEERKKSGEELFAALRQNSCIPKSILDSNIGFGETYEEWIVSLVKAFQKSQNIPTTGIMREGDATAQALSSSNMRGCYVCNRDSQCTDNQDRCYLGSEVIWGVCVPIN